MPWMPCCSEEEEPHCLLYALHTVTFVTSTAVLFTNAHTVAAMEQPDMLGYCPKISSWVLVA